jgi:bifunctional enzyme CysN/CysC
MQDEDMNIVIVGHVDHGKSTIIGRLLADTNSLPLGKLEQVREKCRRSSKPFEYAFLLDALKDEQEQGITIDSARCFFKTEKRKYILIDAPGHIEFLKNMVTGAARAEAALLVIDANEGIKENSKRHGYLLSMLGIKQLCVLINKMDLVGYDKNKYDAIVREYSEFLKKINVTPSHFIPVSGFKGENILNKSENMPWYADSTLLEVLDGFISEKSPNDKPFRMPVQGVYKFTKEGDDRRIVAGTVETGVLNVGDEVCFYPSGKKSKIKTIEVFNSEKRNSVSAGCATGFTLDEQIYVKRGDLVTISGQKEPKVTSRIKVNLFWLGKNTLEQNKEYYLKLGTAKVIAKVEKILKVLNASSLDSKTAEKIERNEVAECILELNKEIALDLSEEIANTGRFVIIDNYNIAGGGIVLEKLENKEILHRENNIIEKGKWQKSDISIERRENKYKQKATLILITEKDDSIGRALARKLEVKLFAKGNIVYCLENKKLLYDIDADAREEQIQQLAEFSNVMLDAGIIIIAPVTNLSKEDIKIVKKMVDYKKVEIILIGDCQKNDLNYSLNISNNDSLDISLNVIENLLLDKGIIN